MALSLVSAGSVFKNTRRHNLSSYVFYAIKQFGIFWASFKGNADLQFLPFTGTSIDDATGQVLADAACRVYVVYGQKTNTATDAYLVIFDDATDDAGAATDARIVLPFLEVNEVQLFVSPQGVTMGTGVVAKSYTDFDGTTDTSAGDAPNGFVIIGAP